MFGWFRHCRAYALATLLVINLFPAVAVAVSETATVTVTGHVCLPEDATPIILSPAPGSTSTESVITVSGTTTAPAVPITLERNVTPAGVTIPEPDGTWSLPVTLTPGANTLVAVACQDSTPIAVTYNIPPARPSAEPVAPTDRPTEEPSPGQAGEPASPEPPGGLKPGPITGPFFLTTSKGLLSGQADQVVSVELTIHGGLEPYQLELAWGDGTMLKRTIERRSTQKFNHRFRAGTFKPLAQMTDADGRKASLAYVAQITPRAEVPGIVEAPKNPDDLLKLLLIEAALTVVVFAGWEEIHQRHLLANAGCPGRAS